MPRGFNAASRKQAAAPQERCAGPRGAMREAGMRSNSARVPGQQVAERRRGCSAGILLQRGTASPLAPTAAKCHRLREAGSALAMSSIRNREARLFLGDWEGSSMQKKRSVSRLCLNPVTRGAVLDERMGSFGGLMPLCVEGRLVRKEALLLGWCAGLSGDAGETKAERASIKAKHCRHNL